MIKRVIVSGRVVEGFSVEYEKLHEDKNGVFVVTSTNYECPFCKGSIFFICPDKKGKTLACNTEKCMQRDRRISLADARKKYYREFAAIHY